MKNKLAILGFTILSGCFNSAGSGEDRKVNVHYWTITGNETCAKMAGTPHCFLNKDIDAHSFATDSSAGFLLLAPIGLQDLVECNESRYNIDWHSRPYPNIQINVGEPSLVDKDTIDKFYWRIRENYLGKDNPYLARPLQYVDYFGEKCLKNERPDLSGHEVKCYGGEVFKDEPAYFFGCSGDYRVPNPGCKDVFVNDGLDYRVSYSKKCAAYSKKIRQFAIEYVKQAEQRAKLEGYE